jgi:hypothetical protein
MALTAGITAAVTSVASAGVSAYGASENAKASKQQAKYNAGMQELQAQLSNFNADQAETYGRVNANLTLGLAGLNNQITRTVADVNTSLIRATTDFNVKSLKATTDFNVSSAEGAARLLAAQGEAQALLHENNAKLAEVSAQGALEQGKQSERVSRASYAGLKGKQRAALAASGVALDEGSALRIQSDTDYLSDVDADTIRTNAMQSALGYRIQGVNETMSSRMASLNGKAQALDKRAEALASRIQGETAAFQAGIDGSLRELDTKMTSTFQILATDMNSQVGALNIKNQAAMDAWNYRAQAIGYTGQAQQSRLTAQSISPMLAGGTSLLAGVASTFGQVAGLAQAGVFGGGSTGKK